MSKLFIDKIRVEAEREELSPAPGTYNLPSTFGREGLKRTFGVNPRYELKLLEKKSEMPGPGQY